MNPMPIGSVSDGVPGIGSEARSLRTWSRFVLREWRSSPEPAPRKPRPCARETETAREGREMRRMGAEIRIGAVVQG